MNGIDKLLQQAEDKVAEELRDTGLRLGLIAATLLTGNSNPSEEAIKHACLAAVKIFATSAQTAVQLSDSEV